MNLFNILFIDMVNLFLKLKLALGRYDSAIFLMIEIIFKVISFSLMQMKDVNIKMKSAFLCN